MMVASTRMSLILSGEMRVIGAIEDEVVIKKILKHLGLWLPKRSPSPRAHVAHPPWRTPPQAVRIDYLDFQIPSADDYLNNPDRSTLRLSTGYLIDSWLN